MKKIMILFCLTIFVLNLTAQDLVGDWEGELSVQGMKLPLVFHVQKDGDNYSSTMDSPAQGAMGITVDKTSFSNNEFSFEIAAMKIQYKGKLDNATNSLDGTFLQGGMNIPLTASKVDPNKIVKKEIVLSENADQIAGDWNGMLDLMGTKLRLVFHLVNKGGELSGTMDSPDQKAMGIPLSSAQYKDGELKVEMKAMSIVYTAKPNNDFTSLDGTFVQMGRKYKMNMSREAIEKAVVNRPQEPKDFPYDQEDVSYENPTAGIKLAGTLTLPKKEGQYPVVILISGSGAQDRNEEILGHKPFLVLSDYLTRQGVAVLRFDDRGVGGSTGDHAAATSADFATDVLAAVEYLKSRKEIKHHQIGLMGHSEGGLIAPMVAAQSTDIAFLVSLAGTGMNGGDILILQSELIALAEGEDKDEVKKNVKALSGMIDIINSTPDIIETEKKLKKYIGEEYDLLSDKEKKEIGDKESFSNNQIKAMNSVWMRYFLSYDPTVAWAKVKCPVLAINGEKDLQVPPKENLSAIAKTLKAAGNTNVITKELPKLNHLFQTTETGAVSEYGKLEETFSEEAMKLVTEWILKVTE